MATVTIKIDTKNKKAKYLVDLITELSKTEKGITVIDEKSEFMKSIDQSFNELEQLKKGKLKPKPARELLGEL
jgi:16S rRNA G1207 methylase RsmC